MKRPHASPYNTPKDGEKDATLAPPADKAVVVVQEGMPELVEDNRDTSAVIISGTIYIVCSSSLILLNKHALSSFDFHCPNSLLCFHCALAVLLVKLSELFGLIKLEPLKWNIIKIWFPVNLIFVGMIVTSFYALKLIGVGMFTILKNLSNFITIIGDWYFFSRTYNLQVWSCLLLMVTSACFGGYTDIKFTWAGYAWQLVNCVFTSAYALYLSGAMSRVAPHTSDQQRMSEFSMVYYNNLLSIFPILGLMAYFGEFGRVLKEPAIYNFEFQCVAFFGGLLGFGISFASLWYMSRTTATVYSLTGSMNKVIVAVAGLMLFKEPTNLRNSLSIGVGLLAGVIFVLAKSTPNVK